MKPVKSSLSWTNLYLITFLASYVYTFNEWLFAVTKPSFINGLATAQQLQIFLVVSALLASLCFVVLLSLVILSHLPFLNSYKDILIKLGSFLPTVIVAALILIMVDNFTYTVFKWGIVLTKGWNRIVYGLGFLSVIFLTYRFILNIIARLNRGNRIWGIQSKWILSLLTGVIFLSITPLLFPDRTIDSSFPITTPTNINTQRKPHILFNHCRWRGCKSHITLWILP